MTIRKSRLKFYLVLYALTGCVAILGLAIGIHTIPVNEDTQKLSIQVKALQDENQRLKLKVLTETRLEVVDQIATGHLGMHPPESVTYIQEKDKPNVFNDATP
jgi:cell division protein FtsL